MSIEAGEHKVVCQKWEESERGMGTRPDGFSLHLSFDGLKRYIKTYWDRMPDDIVPSTYSKAYGTPYEVGVSDEVVADITAAGDGLRFHTNDYPGHGGIDGWRHAPSR